MQEYVLPVTGKPDIKFKGTQIVENCRNEEFGGHFTSLELYKTESGKYVCCRDEITRQQGAEDEFIVKICTSHAEIIAFFGQSNLAHMLYQEANIENIEVID